MGLDQRHGAKRRFVAPNAYRTQVKRVSICATQKIGHPRSCGIMNKPAKIIVYSTGSPLKEPFKLMAAMLADLYAARGLAWRLFVRNISAKYRRTIFGYLWAILPPLFTSSVWIFLNSQKVFITQPSEIPYPMYVLTGTILWQIFTSSIYTPVQVVITSSTMLAKINFPRESLIIAALLEILFNTVIQIFLLVIVFIYFDISISLQTFMSLFGVISLILFGLMIGLLITPIAILYGDIQQALPMLLQPLFYLTPIIYTVPKTGVAHVIATYNPISPLIIFTRDLITTGEIHYLWPSFITLILTCFFLVAGWVIFRLAMPHLIERISS